MEYDVYPGDQSIKKKVFFESTSVDYGGNLGHFPSKPWFGRLVHEFCEINGETDGAAVTCVSSGYL